LLGLLAPLQLVQGGDASIDPGPGAWPGLVRQRLSRIKQRQGLFGASGSREPLGDSGCHERLLQGSGLVIAILRQIGLRIPQGIGDGQHRQAHRLAAVVGVGIEIWIVIVCFVVSFVVISLVVI